MTRRRWILVVVGALVVVGLAVLGGFWLHFAQKPPDFVAGPGKHRVTPPASTDGRNVTYPANITVDGTHVLVQTNGVDKVQGHLVASMYVRLGDPAEGQAPPPSVRGDYAKGSKIHLGGVTVEILDLWDEPSNDNDAVDVRVTRP